ncbi:TROVE domain-containing protein [Mycobacterium sp.]|uniref:TROVE domain-containing protein n=1 Tax=Mycobacterium sp. TaxID=1785 RepID=UPI002D93EA52|nr:TROVE domain-containing protein [Mycobacterium sp.]
MDLLRLISTRRTAQSEPADPRQVTNAAGGYTFTVDEHARLHRFLTLGTDGGTYYTNALELTRDNADVVLRAAATDPVALVRQIVDVSTAGRAPRQNPALFALAIAASAEDVDGRRAALAALPKVARTGTHLFLFARYVEQFRGWGPTLRKAVAQWYTGMPVDKLAYQLVKYRQREGWSHYDLLRLASPSGVTDPARRMAFNWAARKGLADYPDREASAGQPPLATADNVPESLALIADFEAAQAQSTTQGWVDIINRGRGLSWEMLPDAALAEPQVWHALIDQGLPQTALMRQLPRLTRLGVLAGDAGRVVATQLQDPQRLIRARVHPINVLVAQRTYASGQSARGEGTWTPDPRICDALDAAFYNAYGAVEPANRRTLLALDVSGSMGSRVSGLPLTCREASAALAMVTAATEPDYRIVGFTDGARNSNWDFRANTVLTKLDISPRRRLDDICRYTAELPMGGTDCALPMVWALKRRAVFDVFEIITDNETWYGSIHPHQALREYREKVNPRARLVVVSMTGTRNSITDPADPLSLSVSGFDSAVPQLIADFSRGDL